MVLTEMSLDCRYRDDREVVVAGDRELWKLLHLLDICCMAAVDVADLFLTSRESDVQKMGLWSMFNVR
jgi:hypothetical protein